MLNDYELIESITSPEGVVNVYSNGLVESIINEGAYIDVQYLLTGKAKLEQLRLGKKFYVLADSIGYYRVSREARHLSASKQYSGHIGAVAVITAHISIKYTLELYYKIDKPLVPTKAFTDQNAAIKWLLDKMEEDENRTK